MSNARIPARPTLPLDLPVSFHGMDSVERNKAVQDAIKQIPYLAGSARSW